MKLNTLRRRLLALTLASFATASYAVTDISTCQTISLPGSYRLTQNLQANGTSCIQITVPNVTLDLQGHGIFGTRQLATHGVTTPEGRALHSIVVRNGTIAFFGTGVFLSATTHSVRVENLQVHGNTNSGIAVGSGAIVNANSVHDNGTIGIFVGSSATNGDGALVTNNLVLDNDAGGIFIRESGSTVSGNVVRRNEQDGIQIRCPSNVHNNTSTLSPTGSLDIRFVLKGCTDVNNLAPKRATLD